MRYSLIFPAILKCWLTACMVLVTTMLFAHTSTLQKYVIFGGANDCRNHSGKHDCGVLIGDNSKITGGAIGSPHRIVTKDKVDIAGSLVSARFIELGEKNVVGGNISAGNAAVANSIIFQTGKYATLRSDIDINGNSTAGSGSKLYGKLTHPSGTTYYGPAPAGGNITGIPSLPSLPAMLSVTKFAPAGSQSFTGNGQVSPGAYNHIKLNGNKTLCFKGPGVYTFNSIKNSGTNTFEFDFLNADGVIRL